jgi:Ni/Co efflux regulator RcnB
MSDEASTRASWSTWKDMKRLMTTAMILSLLGGAAAEAAGAGLGQDRPERQGRQERQGGDRGPGSGGGRGDGGGWRQSGGDRGDRSDRGDRGGQSAPQAQQPQPAPQPAAAPQPRNPREGVGAPSGRGDQNRNDQPRGDRGGQDRGNQGRGGQNGWDRGPGRGDQGRPDQGRPDQGRPGQGRPDQGRPGWDRPGQGRPDQGGRPGQNGQWRDRDHDRPRYDQNRYRPSYRSQQRYRVGAYRYPRGFYVNRWSFGDYLPGGWYGQSYYLNAWQYGLPTPPIGCEWVRVGDDALLVDVWSGQVLSVYYDLFW